MRDRAGGEWTLAMDSVCWPLIYSYAPQSDARVLNKHCPLVPSVGLVPLYDRTRCDGGRCNRIGWRANHILHVVNMLGVLRECGGG